MPKERAQKKSRVHKEIQKEGIEYCFVLSDREVSHSFLGINFNKEFGQHILKNPLIIASMVEKVISLVILGEERHYSLVLLGRCSSN